LLIDWRLTIDCWLTHSTISNRQSAIRNKKGHRHILAMPGGFAGDPAPQQLTAPCRKYSGRLHLPIEQVVYRSVFLVIESAFIGLAPDEPTNLVIRLRF
jgi:hypothetical protein